METLIGLYDNFLIYYSNPFFSLLGIMGLIFLFFVVGLVNYLLKTFKVILEELKKVKLIKRKNSNKVKLVVSVTSLFVLFSKGLIQAMFNVKAPINAFFKYVEIITLKFIKRIGKEILIDQ